MTRLFVKRVVDISSQGVAYVSARPSERVVRTGLEFDGTYP